MVCGGLIAKEIVKYQLLESALIIAGNTVGACYRALNMTSDEQAKRIPDRFDDYSEKSTYDLIKQLPMLFGGGSGSGQFHQVQSILALRTADLVNKQLADTASSISQSANRIKDALDKFSAGTGERVASVGSEVQRLTASLEQAAQRIEAAGNQSADAARKLNLFTLFLGVGTLLLFVAACWQAYETGRQADIAARELVVQTQITSKQETPQPPKSAEVQTIQKPTARKK